ncbi:MAG: hypothetical protein IPN70_03460 [Candidatus Moraniibacteriota bacterium]|nr:MAG: hypothetical protein IPN70_03460 [Candidatus Moranbacteria bacterium]
MFSFLFSHKKNSPLKNFIILLCFLFINLLSVWLLGHTPWLATIPILLSGILALYASKSKKLLIVYYTFALIGSLHEMFFISMNVWTYDKTSFLSIPLYLPFVWGNISILCISLYKGIFTLKIFQSLPHNPPKSSTIFLAFIFAFIFSILSIYFFWSEPSLVFILFILIDIFLVFIIRSAPFAIVGINALGCGALGDLVAVNISRWSYSVENTIFGVPSYIFIGWDIVGLLMVSLYLALEAFEKEHAQKKSRKAISH